MPGYTRYCRKNGDRVYPGRRAAKFTKIFTRINLSVFWSTGAMEKIKESFFKIKYSNTPF
jgi:hypothetical protein